MKDKILQLAKGDFSKSHTKLRLSENHITLQVEEGRTESGSLYIGSESGIAVQGVLYTECLHFTIDQTQFHGKEISVTYSFSAKEHVVGETINSKLVIISNCGEYEIPITVVIEKPTLVSGDGKIGDLVEFAALAKQSYEEAVEMFARDDFSHVFLYKDVNGMVIYDTVRRQAETRLAMEEFLVALKKKKRIQLQLDRTRIQYDNCVESFQDEIHIRINTWGCSHIKIASDSAFVVPEMNEIWTDECSGDEIPVRFVINKEKLHVGGNLAHLVISSIQQMFEVTIEIEQQRSEQLDKDYTYYFKAKMVKEYLSYRNNKISLEQYITKFDELLVQFRGRCSEVTIKTWQVHTAILTSQESSVTPLIEELYLLERPLLNDPLEEILEYAGACYITTIAASMEDKEEYLQRSIRDIRYFYDNGYHNWELCWFLLNLEARYKDARNAFNELMEYVKKGCSSPIIYMELCLLVKRNPYLMHDWDNSLIHPLAWGIKEGHLDRECAITYTYHVGRVRQFEHLVFTSLETLYEQFRLDETLQAICTILIRSEKVGVRYLKWYEEGIKKQLRITQIYEYYMQSLPDDSEKLIPHQVMLYFLYDNALAEREKILLYSSVIRAKEQDPAVYKSYTLMIQNFARKQLTSGKISLNLAKIYEECIKLTSIDESIARALPSVMFSYELVCENPNIRGVIVVHNEVEGECFSLLEGSKAIINIYTDHAHVFLVDFDGNRYLIEESYILNKMLYFENYCTKCYELCKDNKRMLTYMYSKVKHDYELTGKHIAIRRSCGQSLHLRTYDKRKNLFTLGQYYYDHAEGEQLDVLLHLVKIEDADPATRQKWIELYMIRGMFEQAMDALSRYSYQEIDFARLGRFCEEAITRIGRHTREPVLIDIASRIFKNGKYSEILLSYLSEHYYGPTKDMLELWKVSKGFHIVKDNLEERLLGQLLFTEQYAVEGIPVLENYLLMGNDKNLKKAYISYLAYRYVLFGDSLKDTLFNWMKENLVVEFNTVCTLALIKWYSKCEILQEDEINFCDCRIHQMVMKGIELNYFKTFSRYFKLPSGMEDKAYIEYMGVPNQSIQVKYMLGDGQIRYGKAIEVYYGLYVRHIVLFHGERATYEIYSEKNGNVTTLHTGAVDYEDRESTEISRFGMLNRMMEYASANDGEALFSAMECYVKLEEASKSLFTPL